MQGGARYDEKFAFIFDDGFCCVCNGTTKTSLYAVHHEPVYHQSCIDGD
jgi:hypothetical protein